MSYVYLAGIPGSGGTYPPRWFKWLRVAFFTGGAMGWVLLIWGLL